MEATGLTFEQGLVPQRALFERAAQAGVAAGVGDALRAGVIDVGATDQLVIVAAVWLNPSANDEEEVFRNQRQAMIDALTNGKSGKPTAMDVMKATENVANPFFRTK
jgi:5,6,7,8-tetrahydromethanopterin hydro-lyase